VLGLPNVIYLRYAEEDRKIWSVGCSALYNTSCMAEEDYIQLQRLCVQQQRVWPGAMVTTVSRQWLMLVACRDKRALMRRCLSVLGLWAASNQPSRTCSPALWWLPSNRHLSVPSSRTSQTHKALSLCSHLTHYIGIRRCSTLTFNGNVLFCKYNWTSVEKVLDP